MLSWESALPLVRSMGSCSKAAPAELYLPQGWVKLAAKPPGVALRVRTASGAFSAADAVAVVHAENDAIEVFVETGSGKMLEPGKSGADGAAHDLKSGEFALRATDRPFATAGAAPQKFVGALPRHFRDPLPSRATCAARRSATAYRSKRAPPRRQRGKPP